MLSTTRTRAAERAARALESLLRMALPAVLCAAPAFATKCGHCGKAEAPSRCGGCKVVGYCSRECQKADWPLHRLACAVAGAPPVPGGAGAEAAKPAGPAPASGAIESKATGKTAAAASATVHIGEADFKSGQVTGPAAFATENVVFCQVGLFLTQEDGGTREYYFAHHPRPFIGDPSFLDFLKAAAGKKAKGVIFASQSTVDKWGAQMQADLGQCGLPLEMVPYEWPDLKSAYTFTVKLEGKALALTATDGTHRIEKAIPLED